MMNARELKKFVKACQAPIDRMFKDFEDAGLRKTDDKDEERRELRAELEKAVRFLSVTDEPLEGDPAGWAAGLVFCLTSVGVGVPGISNADLEKCFGVTMNTIRKRAEQAGSMVFLRHSLLRRPRRG